MEKNFYYPVMMVRGTFKELLIKINQKFNELKNDLETWNVNYC